MITPGRIYYIPLAVRGWESIVVDDPNIHVNHNKMTSVGYIPVYETLELAALDYPTAQIISMEAQKV